MKTTTFITTVCIWLGTFSMNIVLVGAESNTMMCPMNYAPVCGTVQVQCITTPCDPVRQTFSNSCVASAVKATNTTEGACEETSTSTIVGGDRDIHGCIGSAGYSWSMMSQSCVRPWEVKTKKSPREALKSHIWNLESLDGQSLSQSGTLTFSRNMIQAKLCNTLHGRYTVFGDRIYTRGLVSTMMYCEGPIMIVESLLSERGLTYFVGETTLTITTRSGHTIEWVK